MRFAYFRVLASLQKPATFSLFSPRVYFGKPWIVVQNLYVPQPRFFGASDLERFAAKTGEMLLSNDSHQLEMDRINKGIDIFVLLMK